MPSFTVKLIYTPPPEGASVDVGETSVFLCRDGQTVCVPAASSNDDWAEYVNSTPAEALSLARALALVAGCADPRWRGWHWEAREADGRLLAETPIGEWYVSREDCLKAIRTLFGYGARVALDYGDGSGELLSLREPEQPPYGTAATDTTGAEQ